MKISNYYFSLIAVCALFLFCIFILNNSLSTLTAWDNSAFFKKNTHNLFPQGWGFFTRNPREHLVKCYVKNEQNIFNDVVIQCSDSKNVFGLDRSCRAKNAELEVLISQIQDSLWKEEKYPKNNFYDIFVSGVPKDTIKNIFHNPNIFGEIVLLKEERLPWAWSGKKSKLTPPTKYVKVFVSEYKTSDN